MSFEIEIRSSGRAGEVRELAIRAGSDVLTRLLRPGENQPSDFLQAPPEPLAEWLMGNWWRLRWEPIPAGPKSIDDIDPLWRLAHDLRAVGSDYAWPRAVIWGEELRVGISAESAPVGVVGPVRFLTDTFAFVPGIDFEHGVDGFLATIAGTSFLLKEMWAQLNSERDHPGMAEWRRMEAKLGYDADGAPEGLMRHLAEFVGRYGVQDVEEAASAQPGPDAGAILKREVEIAQGADAWVCDFGLSLSAPSEIEAEDSGIPWKRGERLASAVRDHFGKHGPLGDADLADLMHTSQDAFSSLPVGGVPYALRLADHGQDRVLPRSRWKEGRRFEFARALGDALAYGRSGGESLGPIARSQTTRQKFQRAFAQSLLCPFSELIAYVNHDQPDDEDIDAAANYFGVSERMIQTTLVNHGAISQPEFAAMSEAS